HPKLAGGGAEIERGRLQLVDVHRVAQYGEEGLLLGESVRQLLPGYAAVLAAPDRGRSARAGARHRLERKHVDRVGIVRVHKDRKAEIRRQPLGDGAPGAAVVVAAHHADARAIGEAAVVLQVEPAGRILGAGDLVHALAPLRKRLGSEADADALVGGRERAPAVLAEIVAAGGDAELDALSVGQDGVQAQAARPGTPPARVLVVADAGDHLPGVAAVAAAEERGRLDAAPQVLFVRSR